MKMIDARDTIRMEDMITISLIRMVNRDGLNSDELI